MSLITWEFWGFLFFFFKKSGRGGCSSNLLTGHLFGSCFTAQKTWCFFRSSSGVFFVCELAGGYYIGQNIAAAHDISVTLGWWDDTTGGFPRDFPMAVPWEVRGKVVVRKNCEGTVSETSGCSWNILALVYCLYKSPWTPKTNKTVHAKNTSHSLLASFSLRFCRSYVFLIAALVSNDWGFFWPEDCGF